MGVSEAIPIGIDLCHALAAVHGAGLIHRDVKAHNVLREEGGRIVLMDFGTGGDIQAPETADTLAGTPLYLAPELFQNEKPSAQSDIYSLGVLLYHLVTGDYPVKGKTRVDLESAHRTGTRQPLRDVRPDLSPVFINVLERALARESSGSLQLGWRIRQRPRVGCGRVLQAGCAQGIGQVAAVEVVCRRHRGCCRISRRIQRVSTLDGIATRSRRDTRGRRRSADCAELARHHLQPDQRVLRRRCLFLCLEKWIRGAAHARQSRAT